MEEKLVDIEDLEVHFPLKHETIRAVDGVSWHVKKGESNKKHRKEHKGTCTLVLVTRTPGDWQNHLYCDTSGRLASAFHHYTCTIQ